MKQITVTLMFFAFMYLATSIYANAADYRQAYAPPAPVPPQYQPVPEVVVQAAPVPTLPLVLTPLFLPFIVVEALLTPVPLPIVQPAAYQAPYQPQQYDPYLQQPY